MDKTQPHPLFKLATELGPLLVFFAANAKYHLFVATGAFMVAIVAAMIASYVVTRHVPIMAILSGGLLFGRSFIAIMFDQMFNLTPQGWRILTMRWALFFFALAILNEII